MTIEELKNKHPIIEDISEEIGSENNIYYSVVFVLGGCIVFNTLEELDAYCTRAETIIKSL